MAQNGNEVNASKLLTQYVETFQENLPYALIRLPDEQLVIIMQSCLKNGKPYQLAFEDGAMY
ncbi:MAG: hypothetical protein FWF59_09510 [Turicibacter sp.]|nr:hypothetical protein [Turicibacter sp.]